jgi:hypothetical protein
MSMNTGYGSYGLMLVQIPRMAESNFFYIYRLLLLFYERIM